jgi:toxin ParE1/3/4
VRRIIRSAQSEIDLVAVWRHIADDNAVAASRLLERIDERIRLLSEFPFIGESQPKFGENTRRIIEGNYLIFYDCCRTLSLYCACFIRRANWTTYLISRAVRRRVDLVIAANAEAAIRPSAHVAGSGTSDVTVPLPEP